MSITVQLGNCVEVLRASERGPFDSAVTDPPYELGFMGRAWDRSGVAFQVETWRAVFDQLKPGAHLVAFSSTRTYHRMACAIEDAGFEIRDQLAWTYGAGFPKSYDVSKGIDKAAGAGREVLGYTKNARPNRIGKETKLSGVQTIGGEITAPATTDAAEWCGWGTALKPAWEPICLARKPLSERTVAANVLAHGTGGLNIDACRVDGEKPLRENTAGDEGMFGMGSRMAAGVSSEGRFPANLLHDGSDEVVAAFPSPHGAGAKRPHTAGGTYDGSTGIGFKGIGVGEKGFRIGDEGSAARFFYSAKAGPLDRLGSEHATVKPVDVMRWLCRLVTRPGGLILDPFGGSGTTGIAALAEGFSCEMIELLPEHVADIETKLAHLRGEGARIVERHLKRKAERVKVSSGGLFGDAE